MKRSRAFTLIEIMIALFIFALMASIVSAALYTMFNAREASIEYADKLAEVQAATTLMKLDLRQTMALRLGAEFYGKKESIFVLPRAGVTNPNQQLDRSELVLVSYFVKDHVLLRDQFPIMQSTKTSKRAILENIEAIEFQYFDAGNEVSSAWPVRHNASTLSKRLPKAIQVTLTLKKWGTIRFMVNVPAGARQ